MTRKSFLSIVLGSLLLLLCLGDGYCKPFTFPFPEPIVLDLPDEVPNFINWPGEIISASPEGAVQFLIGGHVSPFDQRYRVLVVVSRKVVNGKAKMYVFTLGTARIAANGTEVENLKWFGDKSYLEGGLPTHKLVRLDGEPNLKSALALQLRSAGSKI